MTLLSRIKTATQDAVKVIGGVDPAAKASRVSRARISEYQKRHSAAVIPVDVAIALDEFAQEPLILSVMAQHLGFVLVPIHIGEGHIPQTMEVVAARSGDTMATTMRIMADGIIDDDEAVELEGELCRLQTAVSHGLKAVRARIKGGKKK